MIPLTVKGLAHGKLTIALPPCVRYLPPHPACKLGSDSDRRSVRLSYYLMSPGRAGVKLDLILVLLYVLLPIGQSLTAAELQCEKGE